MKTVLLAAVTVLAMSSFAAAEPAQLTDSQMDSVTAAGKSVGVKEVTTNVAIVKQHGKSNFAIVKQHGKGKVIVKKHGKGKVKVIARKELRKIPHVVHPYPKRVPSLAPRLRIRF